MEMGGNFCQILELGGTTIKGRRVPENPKQNGAFLGLLQAIDFTHNSRILIHLPFLSLVQSK